MLAAAPPPLGNSEGTRPGRTSSDSTASFVSLWNPKMLVVLLSMEAAKKRASSKMTLPTEGSNDAGDLFSCVKKIPSRMTLHVSCHDSALAPTHQFNPAPETEPTLGMAHDRVPKWPLNAVDRMESGDNAVDRMESGDNAVDRMKSGDNAIDRMESGDNAVERIEIRDR